jgi:gliding motility-associated-like protein
LWNIFWGTFITEQPLMSKFLTLAMLCCIVLHSNTQAYHIIGGEIYYAYLGNSPEGKNVYEITLKLYRNADFTCGDIQGCLDHFEDPVPINVYTSSGLQVINTLLISIKDRKPLRDTLRNPCLAAKTQNLEVAFYRDTIALQPINGGYYVAYQRCCRGQKLANIYDSEHEGSTFYTVIPGLESRPTNNSAYFNKDAAIVICAGMPLKFDYSAYDPDGDSLTYMLCEALDGGASRNETAGSSAPPYNSTVSYISPYSGADPMGGSPQVGIDNNGFLVGTPTTEGQYVMSVCVNEYDRKTKKLLGTHHKDILLTVFNCSTKITAGFPSTLKNCVSAPDLSIPIVNSSNAGYTSQYYWNFGDGTDTITYSQTVFRHNYPDTGTYKVKLVVNPGLPCADSTTGIVSDYPGLNNDFTMAGVCTGDTVAFADQSSYASGKIIDRRWDFGLEEGTPYGRADGTNVTHVYDQGGTYTVALTLYTNHDCTSTVTKDLNIYEVKPAAGNDTIMTRGQQITLHASGGQYYQWSPPDGLSSSNIPDPLVTWNNDITYVLRVSNDQGCVGYDTIAIKYYTGPEMYVPNAFSPNGDGKNDYFRFIPVGMSQYNFFRIFNRWGQLMYSSVDFHTGWDGTYNGQPVPVDTYVWILEGKDFSGNIVKRTGTVTVVK